MKRILSVAAAAACMATVISGTAIPVMTAYAANSTASSDSSSEKKEDTAMKEALETVKSRVKIPDEYSEFTYTKNSSKAKTTYTFKWAKSYASGEYISIRVCGNVITSYYANDVEETEWSKVSFAKLSKDELKNSAMESLKALNPDIAAQLSINDFSVNLHGNTATITFKRNINGLYFSINNGRMTINKDTGRLNSFSMTFWDDAEFPDSSKAIDESKMQESFIENVSLEAQYVIKSTYNSEKKEYDKEAVIIYSPDKTVYFDALTGKPTTMNDDYAAANNTSNYSLFFDTVAVETEEEAIADDADNAAGSGLDSGSVSLTDNEKQALIESEKYYSQKDAVELLREDKYLNLTDEYVLSYSNFSRNDNAPSGCSWYFSFYINTKDEYKSIDVTMDAESGKILSFYKYKNKDSTKIIDVKSVNKTAESAAEYYLSDKIGEYKANDDNTRDADKETQRTIVFTRQVNGLPVKDDIISVTVDSDGEVMRFNYRYTDIAFPSADGIISKEKAYSKLFAQTDFDLYYDGFQTLDGTPKTYMIFNIEGYSYSINARTGKLCSSNGTEVIIKDTDQTECPYTDISGHWSEKYITELYDYGVRLSTDEANKFDPDEYITNAEFAALLDKVFYTDIMPVLYKDDGYTYQTSKEFGNETMTKTDLAKQFVICAGGEEFASLKGVYKSPFNDVKEDDENIGYISLAYGMGAVKSDSSGNFNPNAKVTRAYAMYMIYNYINTLS